MSREGFHVRPIKGGAGGVVIDDSGEHVGHVRKWAGLGRPDFWIATYRGLEAIYPLPVEFPTRISAARALYIDWKASHDHRP